MSHNILLWLLLTALWCLLWQDLHVSTVLLGMGISAVVLGAQSRTQQKPSVVGRARTWITLVLFVGREFLISSMRIAWDVLTPGHQSHPLMIEYPLRLAEPNHIAIFSSSITFTPGTLTVDDYTRDGQNYLLIHLLYADDPKAVVASIKELEDLLIACFKQSKASTEVAA